MKSGGSGASDCDKTNLLRFLLVLNWMYVFRLPLFYCD